MDITALTAENAKIYDAHIARHRAESGRGDYHFMPYHPDEDGPRPLDSRRLEKPLREVGWMRHWVVWTARADIVGHIELHSLPLNSSLHRCELGMGLERDFRGEGLGQQLLDTALQFCRGNEQIEWVDLRVFAHNSNARKLYNANGFKEVGIVKDCFRIGSMSIDDVMMTLRV